MRRSRVSVPISFSRILGLGSVAHELVRLNRVPEKSARHKATRHLAERLGKLHGLPQKIGQILSLANPANPENPFTSLTEGETVLAPEEAFAEIERRLGSNLSSLFSRVEEQGISASLAQVHRATLRNGSEVAIKFLYPGIEKALWLDLKSIGWLTAPLGGIKKKGFDLEGYRVTIKRILEEEMDYTRERRMTETFYRLTSNHRGFVSPQVFSDYCRPRILTLSWIEGVPIQQILSWPVEQREEIGRLLIELFLRSLLEWRLLHGDPHSGNYRFLRSGNSVQVGILDFGCVYTLSPESSAHFGWMLRETMAGSLEGKEEACLEAMTQLGFNPDLTAPMRERLPETIAEILAPFRGPQPFDLKSWNLGENIERILGEMRWNFRLAGPPDLLLFIRAYQGLIHYLCALDVRIDWSEVTNRVLATKDFTFPLSFSTPEIFPRPHQAEHLKIQVTENGQEKARIIFRAIAAENLRDLMPDDLLCKLRERNIDIDRISQEVKDSGFSKGVLFEMEENSKRVCVWLE